MGGRKMEKDIKLNAKEFATFLKCMSAVQKAFCSDVNIKGGFLRQKSNDGLIIIEMDLTSLISDCDIILENIKNKLALFNPLAKQDVNIKINEKKITFSGVRSLVRFDMPSPDSSANKFMPCEELNNLISLKEEDLVLEYAVKKDVSGLIKAVCKQFAVNSVRISFGQSGASISAITKNKEQYSEIDSGIPFNNVPQGYSNLYALPFIVDHDGDISLKIYNIQDNVRINKFKTSIGTMDFTIYGRSPIVEE